MVLDGGMNQARTIKTISEYLNSKEAYETLVLVDARRETAKAIGVKHQLDNRIAWFPKSQCAFLKDDFYNEKSDRWAVPMWLVNRKAAEMGTFAHEIVG
jgi:hypothetical protein